MDEPLPSRSQMQQLYKQDVLAMAGIPHTCL